MKIGLIDVDGHNFPSLPLMKISSYYKARGHSVGWYDGSHCDRVYLAKVFSFSPDYTETIDADEVYRGGQDTPSHWWTEGRSTTRQKTRRSRKRLSIASLIMGCTASPTRHTAS